MPIAITSKVSPQTTYKLREFHGRCAGVPLWAWDSESKVAGFESVGGIAQQSLSDAEAVQFAIEGPPATLFTLSVDNFVQKDGGSSGTPVPVEFELLAGHGRAAYRVVHVTWSPTAYFAQGNQAWIFQFNGLLASSWWLFAKFNGTPFPPCNIAYKVLIERATVLLPTDTRVGPDVVVIP